MGQFIKTCKRTDVRLMFGNNEVRWKPTATIRNKFCQVVAPAIERVLNMVSSKLAQRYKDLLFAILVNKDKSKIDEWIDTIIQITDQTYAKIEEEDKIEYPDLSKDFDDPVTVEEFRQFHKLSIALRLASFVVHYYWVDELSINTNYIVDRIVRHYISKQTMKKILDFIITTVNNSLYAREAMWKYLTETIGITPERRIQMDLNYFFKAMMIYFDASKQPNVMSYLAAFINQSLYYLYTDTYERSMQYVNIMKVRFTKHYNLIKQQAVFLTFDLISNLMKKIFPTPAFIESDLLSKTYNITPYDVVQKGKFVNPVTKYVTYPLLQFIYEIDANYYSEYRDIRYVELYLSLITENVLKLPYLAKLMRSVAVDKHKRKIKIARQKYELFEKLKFSEKRIFDKKKFFINVIQETKNYLYYDPVLHDIYIVDPDQMSDEYLQFYRMLLIEKDRLSKLVDPIRKWYNVPEALKSRTLELEAIF